MIEYHHNTRLEDVVATCEWTLCQRWLRRMRLSLTHELPHEIWTSPSAHAVAEGHVANKGRKNIITWCLDPFARQRRPGYLKIFEIGCFLSCWLQLSEKSRHIFLAFAPLDQLFTSTCRDLWGLWRLATWQRRVRRTLEIASSPCRRDSWRYWWKKMKKVKAGIVYTGRVTIFMPFEWRQCCFPNQLCFVEHQVNLQGGSTTVGILKEQHKKKKKTTGLWWSLIRNILIQSHSFSFRSLDPIC